MYVHGESNLPVSPNIENIDVSVVITSQKGLSRSIERHLQEPHCSRMVSGGTLDYGHHHSVINQAHVEMDTWNMLDTTFTPRQ